MDDMVMKTVCYVTKIGEEQFTLFVVERSKPVTQPLKKDNLPTFTSRKKDRFKRKGESGSFEGGLCLFFAALNSMSTS